MMDGVDTVDIGAVGTDVDPGRYSEEFGTERRGLENEDTEREGSDWRRVCSAWKERHSAYGWNPGED